jgi:hypothetical protein
VPGSQISEDLTIYAVKEDTLDPEFAEYAVYEPADYTAFKTLFDTTLLPAIDIKIAAL